MALPGKQLRRITGSLVALVAVVGAAACGGDDNGGGNNGGGGLPASTSYVGLYASASGATGPLTITFASAVATPPVGRSNPGGPLAAGAAPVEATGTVEVSGTVIPLTGTLDQGTLAMTGEGGLTIDGTLADGVITGTFTAASETGSITAASNTDGTPAHAYCGTFTGTESVSGDPDLGTFSAVIAGTTIHGVAVGEGGTVNDFEGTAAPAGSGGTFTIHQTVAAGTLDVTDGAYNGETTSGHYSVKVGGVLATSGTFSGLIDCPAPQ